MDDVRWEPRESKIGSYSLTWKDHNGLTHSAEGRGVDISKSGIGIECGREFKPGSLVYIHARDGSVDGDCIVVHCTKRGVRFHVGLEFREETQSHARMPGRSMPDSDTDYYDILQISPGAEFETVHRVFRIMAARFHPDNPETGDVEQFLRMKEAYAVLSDPARRAEYDAQRACRDAGPMPIFELKDFVTGVEAEHNRRLGVLSLLYNQRRIDPDHPGVSLLDMEQRMGFPREYLSFTMWYLCSKQFVAAADNSDYTLHRSRRGLCRRERAGQRDPDQAAQARHRAAGRRSGAYAVEDGADGAQAEAALHHGARIRASQLTAQFASLIAASFFSTGISRTALNSKRTPPPLGYFGASSMSRRVRSGSLYSRAAFTALSFLQPGTLDSYRKSTCFNRFFGPA
jgi:curved DNA-binding protein CbpA